MSVKYTATANTDGTFSVVDTNGAPFGTLHPVAGKLRLTLASGRSLRAHGKPEKFPDFGTVDEALDHLERASGITEQH